MPMLKTLCAAAALVLLTPVAHANLINNGGFEDNAFTGWFTTISAGSGLSAWTVESGSVDLINTYWQPAAGSYSIDLNGTEAGRISQSFATAAGQTYNVSFSMAGNTDNTGQGGVIKSLTTGVAGNHTYTFDVTGNSSSAMGWEGKNFSFVATGASSTLFFAGSSSNGAYGAALDNVSVTAVPEAETVSMLLAGLGLMGAIVLRRKGQPD